MDIAKLNTMINQSEEQMTKLRNRYEKAITHRNESKARVKHNDKPIQGADDQVEK